MDHHLDAKKMLDFPIYLFLHVLAEVCNPKVLLFANILQQIYVYIFKNRYNLYVLCLFIRLYGP